MHDSLVHLAGHDLDDAPGEVETGVVVRPQLAERRQLRQAYEVGDHVLEGVVARPVVGEVVAHPARCVGQEMPHRDARRDVLVRQLELREVPPDGHVEIELATLDERHRDGARERLRDRADLKQRVGRDLKRVLDRRHAEACAVLLATAHEAHGGAGGGGLDKRSLDRGAEVVEERHARQPTPAPPDARR